MRESEFFQCLKSRFGGNDYTLIPQVRSTTGFSNRIRTADALAVSLWPSRGVGIEGFEFKDSRSDWKKELDDPSKAEEIGRYCRAWWVVVSSPAFVFPGELPVSWGLLHATDGLVKTLAKPKAAFPAPQEPTWAFVASILKAAGTVSPEADVENRIEKARSEEHDKAYKSGVESGKSQTKRLLEDADRLRKAVAAFEQSSGVRLDTWNSDRENEKIGKAVKFAMTVIDTDFMDIYERHLRFRLESLEKLRADLLALVPAEPESDPS